MIIFKKEAGERVAMTILPKISDETYDKLTETEWSIIFSHAAQLLEKVYKEGQENIRDQYQFIK